MMKIGVLALQGDFHLHSEKLKKIGISPVIVKKPKELNECSGLIIPGGESTTLVKLMKKIGLFEAIPEFNRERPIFGTCAGAILASKKVYNHPVEPLGLIDITTERNAYGRQIDSFVDNLDVVLGGQRHTIESVFIRAPKIRECGKSVEILSVHKNDIVLVESDRVLAATFHPELTDSVLIHQYFAEKAKKVSPEYQPVL